MHTLIIGAGVVGLSIAWELCKRGQPVSVLDARRAGRGASWAGAGILPPAPLRNVVHPYEQLASLSHRLHAEWAVELRDKTGIDTGFRRCGGIYLARSRAEFATLKANELWWEEHGIDFEQWDLELLRRRVPRLMTQATPELLAAWHLPSEWQLRNPQHLQALLEACRGGGVNVFEDCEIASLERAGQRVTAAITSDGKRWQADAFCICSGAWARHLLDQLQLANGIMPVRGQMLLYKLEHPPFTQVVNDGNRYLVPREDGHLLAGSVEEEVGYDCRTTQAGLAQIRGWAEKLFPDLRNAQLKKTWAGLRPGSYDGLPYIGQVPSQENVFIASGHFRSGLHLSPGTAVCLADVMLGQESPIELSDFRVGRG